MKAASQCNGNMPGWNQVLVDFGHHPDSQPAPPQKEAEADALGRYKRGQSANIRAAAMLLGPSIRIALPCGKRSDIAQICQLFDGFNAGFAIAETMTGNAPTPRPSYFLGSAPLYDDPLIRSSTESARPNHMARVFLAPSSTSSIIEAEPDFVNIRHRAGRAAIGVRRPTQSRTYRTKSPERS